ncbi:MAG: hypothetical protein WD200_02620 [Candidatus Andersenbacteria bacterium]
MSFETLQEAILTEARERANQVASELRVHTESEKQRITERAKGIEEAIISQAEAEGAKQARRIRQEAELAGRALVLNAKQEELDATKAALVEELTTGDSKKLLRSLLALVPKVPGTIVPGEKSADELRGLVKGDLKLADKPIRGQAGFVFRSKDSELNLTISQLADQLFIRHRATLAKILFS